MVLAQKQVDQWHIIDDLEINPHSYRHLFKKVPKTYIGEKIASTNSVEKTGIYT
jgi:hypothetical protein